MIPRLSLIEASRFRPGAPSLLELAGGSSGLLAVAAETANLVAVGDRPEPRPGADVVLEPLDLRFEEFDDFPARDADEVVVMLPGVEALVAVSLFADTDAADHAGADQELEAPVDRRARDLLPAFLQAKQELVGFEVLVALENLLEEVAAFRRELQRTAFEIRLANEGL